MLLNEHDSKQLFATANIPVPPGKSVTRSELENFSPDFPLPWYLKAQVLAGGRGKAGGIRRVDRAQDFSATALDILNMEIKGNAVPLLRVEPATDIEREFYLSLTVSREKRSVLLTVGREGGVEIENLGSDNLLVQEIYLPDGLHAHQIRAAFIHIQVEKQYFRAFYELITQLWDCVLKNGLLMAEINPLVLSKQGEFIALDGKVSIDDNLADLKEDLATYYRAEHFAPEENIARDAGLFFVKLGGYVGLMVNGAGLAMASMDLLNYSNLPAANFLDLGGAANHERMKAAIELLFNDEKVEMLLINLYGGILSCKQVALALEAALEGKVPKKPIVARLSGNQAEEGLAILRALNVNNLHLASSMSEAISILESLRPQNAEASQFTPPELAKPLQDITPRIEFTDRPPIFDLCKDTPILVQGITGTEGRLHTELMQAYGANIVAGVTPFKEGQEVLGVPVYSSVTRACAQHNVQASIIFVPPALAADAIREAVANKISWIICITEGIPQHDMLSVLREAKDMPSRIVGPNTPGLIIPGQTKIGILPTDPFSAGKVAVLSRSGTLTYEVAARLTANQIGQSLSMGIGGDPFIGTTFVDACKLLEQHQQTEAVVILGEIGGDAEERLAAWVQETGFHKPIVSFIAGRTAPPGRRLGHAGAILEKDQGILGKIKAMQQGGFTVCPDLDSIAPTVRKVLQK